MLTLPLFLVLTLPAAEPNDAEKLFRDMEKKVTSAKTLECTFEAKLEAPRDQNGTITGEVVLADGNKWFTEYGGEVGGRKGKTTSISDGIKVVDIESDMPNKTRDANKGQTGILCASVARAGLMASFFYVAKELKAADDLKASDFKLGKKEKVGDKEAQVIDYHLTMKGLEVPLSISVWVDTKTKLPLKRVVTVMKGDEKGTITETYSKLKIDEKIDPKKFELPKD
jgi:outer membrane lipoprotein-sorting protein